jgi:putative hydrolase of the HAD superfamily
MPYRFILFDLDETLYRRDTGLLQEIGRRIQTWLCQRLGLTWEQAAALRRDYFRRYGTTLSGLIAERKVDVQDYLTFVHALPVETYLKPDPALATMLAALPLRRVIYTNATREYSWRVLRALDVGDHFERIIGVEDVGLLNKLYPEAYQRALAVLGAQGSECVMVEDSARNLQAAKALGLTTILLAPDGMSPPDGSADFVIHTVLDVRRVVLGALNP